MVQARTRRPSRRSQISLPKGGGAIHGIGEKFTANPVTGTGALTVPIYASKGRLGFGPQLALSYNSGSGSGPFGFGWSLPLPMITRKTDRGCRNISTARNPMFLFCRASKISCRRWSRSRGNGRVTRSRRELCMGNSMRFIATARASRDCLPASRRWINLSDPQDTFWRSITKDNVTTWYGKTTESRISDPADPSRVFSWMICETYDDKGNVASYRYKAEDSTGVDLTQANERNRTAAIRSSQHYIKDIYYGNRTPYFPDLTAGDPPVCPPTGASRSSSTMASTTFSIQSRRIRPIPGIAGSILSPPIVQRSKCARTGCAGAC